MESIAATEPVQAAEVGGWLYAVADRDIAHPSGGGGFLTRDRQDFRKATGIWALDTSGPHPVKFEVHTSDGSAFQVQITQKY